MFLLLVIALIVALLPAAIARSRGQDFFVWWVYSVFLFPIALFHSFVVTPAGGKSVERFVTGRQARRCPHCAETIQDEAKVCKHCGRDVSAAPAPSAASKPGVLACPKCGHRIPFVTDVACGRCGHRLDLIAPLRGAPKAQGSPRR